jgi:protein arginine kinase activator
MICESCHQNLATVHLTEIVQKSKRETHLCEDCARTKGVPYKTQFSVKEFLGGVAPGKTEEAPAAASGPDPFEPCPTCGITFKEFRASGRLGCPNDYKHFERGLRPLLEKIHNASQHTGRVPSRVGQRIERQHLISALQRDLSQAVEREEYERAAELRDKIRALESQQVVEEGAK